MISVLYSIQKNMYVSFRVCRTLLNACSIENHILDLILVSLQTHIQLNGTLKQISNFTYNINIIIIV